MFRGLSSQAPPIVLVVRNLYIFTTARPWCDYSLPGPNYKVFCPMDAVGSCVILADAIQHGLSAGDLRTLYSSLTKSSPVKRSKYRHTIECYSSAVSLVNKRMLPSSTKIIFSTVMLVTAVNRFLCGGHGVWLSISTYSLFDDNFGFVLSSSSGQ